jgi:5-methylcytosine-specific restriction endonuclease McrA
MEDTLVIDLSGRPINVVPWKRTAKMVYEGRVDVVTEDFQGRRLHAPEFEYGMPRVVRCKAYVNKRMRKSIPCSRRNVYVRDKGLCQYCGVWLNLDEFTLEHVVPRTQGGQTTWENTVVACVDCNHKKDGRTPEQAGMKLHHKPVEPKPGDQTFFKLRIEKLRPEWEPWASWLYWNAQLEK